MFTPYTAYYNFVKVTLMPNGVKSLFKVNKSCKCFSVKLRNLVKIQFDFSFKKKGVFKTLYKILCLVFHRILFTSKFSCTYSIRVE